MNQIRRVRFNTQGAWLAFPATLWLVVFFLAPLAIVLLVSFYTRGPRGTFGLPWTDENYRYVTGEFYQPVYERSFEIAIYTTLICLLVGYLLAFYISTRQSSGYRQFLLFLVILPFWTNFVIRTYAWRVLLAQEGILNNFMLDIGLRDEPLQILFTRDAVILGMVYGFLPFMVLPIYASLARFNYKLVNAGYDLGSNDWVVFRRIIFPLTLPGVIAGCILVFIPAVGAFVTPDLLGGPEGRMIGNMISRNFDRRHWPRGAAASMVLMGIVTVGLLFYLIFVERNTYGSTTKRTGRAVKPEDGPQKRRFRIGTTTPMLSLAVALAHKIQIGMDALSDLRLHLWLKPEWRLKRDLVLRKIGAIVLNINPLFCFTFLWIPIFVLVVFSFNDSRSIGGWYGFSLTWYENISKGVFGGESRFSTDLMLDTLQNSLIISISATLISTIIGTMMALALVRGHFFGKRPIQGLLYLPVGIPEIAQGVSLLIFFNRIFEYLNQHLGTHFAMGYETMIIAHVAFSISYVAVVVQARLASMSETLEEAARDLGANHWRTFWRVTFPLALPGIMAGALLAFTISLDDYVVSFFTSGIGTTTLTIFVYGLLKQTVTPEINAISTIMIGVSTVLIAISLILQRRQDNL